MCYKAGEVYLLQSGWYHGTVIIRLSSLLSIAVWRRDEGLFYFTSPLANGCLLAAKDMSNNKERSVINHEHHAGL